MPTRGMQIYTWVQVANRQFLLAVAQVFNLCAAAALQPDVQPAVEHVGDLLGEDPPDEIVGVPR